MNFPKYNQKPFQDIIDIHENIIKGLMICNEILFEYDIYYDSYNALSLTI